MAFPALAAAASLAAAVSPIAGDLDGDGLADRAWLREAGSAYEIVVERGAGGVVVVHTTPDARNLYLGVADPGTYRTWCGKRMNRRSAPACTEPSVTLAGPTLAFGTEEASQAVAVWDGQRFRVVWLSD